MAISTPQSPSRMYGLTAQREQHPAGVRHEPLTHVPAQIANLCDFLTGGNLVPTGSTHGTRPGPSQLPVAGYDFTGRRDPLLVRRDSPECQARQNSRDIPAYTFWKLPGARALGSDRHGSRASSFVGEHALCCGQLPEHRQNQSPRRLEGGLPATG